jgi:hypothetical protein
MALEFLGDVGIYLPAEDGIKLTAFEDGRLREYVVTRAALIAAGANPMMDPAALLNFFEQNRQLLEAAAANALPQSSQHWFVRADDVARGRLAAYVAQPNALKSKPASDTDTLYRSVHPSGTLADGKT